MIGASKGILGALLGHFRVIVGLSFGVKTATAPNP